jgi:hypothetical protein
MISDMRGFQSLIIFGALLFAFNTNAQSSMGVLSGGQSTITLEPDFPQPGEMVTATLNVYGSELFDSDVVWSLNGETIGDANNRRRVEYVAGALGVTDELTATILRDGRTYRRYVISYEPSYLDIIFEPQTRVPDFYQGRAVPSIGSQVNATALLNNGEIINPRELIYTWRLNNRVLEGGPIKGTNQVSFEVPRGQDHILALEIINQSGEVLGRRTIMINSIRPELVLYPSNSLYGVSPIAIDREFVLTDQSATLVAEPYFMDIQAYNDPEIIEWEINGAQTTTNAPSPYQITIQQTSEEGQANVTFQVRSRTEILQSGQAGINIRF